jgi:hypothetical protein
MNRPYPRLDEEYHWLSFYQPDAKQQAMHTHALAQVVPDLTALITPDHQAGWVSIRYPSFDNAAVIQSIKQLGYTGAYGGIVTHLEDGMPQYRDRPDRPQMLCDINLVAVTANWLSSPRLRQWVKLVHLYKGQLLGLVTKSPQHFVERFTWPDPQPRPNEHWDTFLFERGRLGNERPYPEVLASVAVSIDHWPNSSTNWKGTVESAIDAAERNGFSL